MSTHKPEIVEEALKSVSLSFMATLSPTWIPITNSFMESLAFNLRRMGLHWNSKSEFADIMVKAEALSLIETKFRNGRVHAKRGSYFNFMGSKVEGNVYH